MEIDLVILVAKGEALHDQSSVQEIDDFSKQKRHVKSGEVLRHAGNVVCIKMRPECTNTFTRGLRKVEDILIEYKETRDDSTCCNSATTITEELVLEDNTTSNPKTRKALDIAIDYENTNSSCSNRGTYDTVIPTLEDSITRNTLTGEDEDINLELDSSYVEEGVHDSGKNLVELEKNSSLTKKTPVKRRWDRKNYCLFCEKLCSNFRRHLLRNHKSEPLVATYIAMLETCNDNESKALRKNIFDDLRNKGNHLYNKQILMNETSDLDVTKLLPSRRPPVTKSPSSSDFIICRFCSSESLKKDILPALKQDEAGKIAMKDPLIMGIASDFYKNHLNGKDKYVITRKIRDAGKLLLKVKEKDDTVKCFEDCIHPFKVSAVMESVKEMCGLNETTGEVKVVGMPARLSWILNEGASRAIQNVIENNSLSDEEKRRQKENIDDFLKVKNRRWRYDVSTNSEISRVRKKMLKPEIVSNEDDIKVFTTFVKESEKKYYNLLQTSKTCSNYENLCEAVICHIITLSRRRPAEATRALVYHYQARGNHNYASSSILASLTEQERKSYSALNLFLVPGKNESRVPIILTEQMKECIDLLLSCRKDMKVPTTNELLFARPGLQTPFDGSKILSKFRKMCPGLKTPGFMTATGLRHQVATEAQVHGEKSRSTQHRTHLLRGARFSVLRSEQTAFGAGAAHLRNDGLLSITGPAGERERGVE
ncbi:hypothetical protein J6590_014389 [Homalodisca vitripennis]|nr:hypothetical protein J6590_014389 [Homalodisca vitripennis]